MHVDIQPCTWYAVCGWLGTRVSLFSLEWFSMLGARHSFSSHFNVNAFMMRRLYVGLRRQQLFEKRRYLGAFRDALRIGCRLGTWGVNPRLCQGIYSQARNKFCVRCVVHFSVAGSGCSANSWNFSSDILRQYEICSVLQHWSCIHNFCLFHLVCCTGSFTISRSVLSFVGVFLKLQPRSG